MTTFDKPNGSFHHSKAFVSLSIYLSKAFVSLVIGCDISINKVFRRDISDICIGLVAMLAKLGGQSFGNLFPFLHPIKSCLKLFKC